MILNNTLFVYLSQTQAFWWLRNSILRISFWFGRNIFGFRCDINREKTNYSSLQEIFRLTEKPLLIALTFAFALQYIDPYLHLYLQKANLHILADSDYITFLATISGIGGVFIGLYYTGITTVGGAIYSRVPNDIRGLLAQERFGNVYMRFLSFLTFLCLVLVALRICNQPKIFIAIPFITLSAGIGIFAFVKLGQRAFNLFDPTELSYHIFEQMQDWLGRVKIQGFRWTDNSFQNHAHRQASISLNTLETLAEIVQKEKHLNGEPFTNLSKNIIIFLINYEYAKAKIPSESHWYEQRYKHREWYRTEDSRVSIAHQTGTTIQPDVIRNNEWIEDRVFKVIKKCVIVNLADGRYSEVLRLVRYFDSYLKTLSKVGKVDRALTLLELFASDIVNSMANVSPEGLVEVEVLEKLAVIENLATIPISIALGYSESLKEITLSNVQSRIDSIRWGESSSIYNVGFNSYCLSRLEWLRPRLEFEEKIEGHQITPGWYLLELVLQVEAEQFAINVKALVTNGIKLFDSIINITTAQKHPWLAAAVMSREWEYWHKIEHLLEICPRKWAEMSNNRKIEGLPWPSFDIKKLNKECENRRSTLLKLMSQQNMLLALIKRPDGFPDYAGQFLHTSGEVSLESLLLNDVELLKSVFEPYMVGCLIQFDSLRPKSGSTDWRIQQDFKIASAALLDLMDISGFAMLLADYHNNDSLWQVVKDAWGRYLNKGGDQSPILLISAAIRLTEAAFEIPHRAILRTNWIQKVKQRLADVPNHEHYRKGRFGSETVIDHKSPLIRVFARGPGGFLDGLDIFVTLYLRNVNGAEDIDLGWKRKYLLEAFEREMNKKVKHDKVKK